MANKKTTRDAVAILHDRYVKDGARRKASLAQQRVNVQVARLIHDMRTDAGLTQAELAKLVGTTQSVISRLEDSDYAGHSLAMLNRIAEALQRQVTLTVKPSRSPARLNGERAGSRRSAARGRA